MTETTTIMWLTGSIDCHFEENARIAIKNVMAGRPLFEGQIPPTYIPERGHGERFQKEETK